MDYIIGKVIDGYKIEKVLGQGGMGTVYLAKDTTLDRDVALKIMDTRLTGDDTFLKRFQSEARALAKLQNPHIVSIYALRETQIGLFIVMEYVDGGTLADRLEEKGALDLHTTMKMFKEILNALSHAHEAGIIHRDIKPGNIMVNQAGQVKVTDFGLAKMQEQASAVTMTVGTGGTLFYMSPEQVRGLANVDQRGDLYSLGITLYETLTGTTPFSDTESDFEIRQNIVEGKVTPPDKLNPHIPKELSKIIMKSIDKSADKRYQTAAEMWKAMEQVRIPVMGTAGEMASAAAASSSGDSSFIPKPVIFGAIGLVLVGVLYLVFGVLMVGESPSTVSISSSPDGAEVEINGNVVGTTPLSDVEVETGRNLVRVTKDDFQAADTLIQIEEGQAISFAMALQATLPGMEEEPIAQSGQTDEQPTPEGTPPQNTGSSGSGSSGQSSGNQTQSMGRVEFSVVPAGTVAVGGSESSASLGSPFRAELRAGEYTVKFTHPQHGTKTQTIRVPSGKTIARTCYFEQYVNIQANPVWGTIYIDGANTGMYTPKDRIPIPVGSHSITVKRDGYNTEEGVKSVNVRPVFQEKVHTLIFTLMKN